MGGAFDCHFFGVQAGNFFVVQASDQTLGGGESARTQHPNREVVSSRPCVRAPSVIHIESGMTVCSPSLFPFAPESITSISLFPSGFVSWSLSEQV